jgi:hypothetical protein
VQVRIEESADVMTLNVPALRVSNEIHADQKLSLHNKTTSSGKNLRCLVSSRRFNLFGEASSFIIIMQFSDPFAVGPIVNVKVSHRRHVCNR